MKVALPHKLLILLKALLKLMFTLFTHFTLFTLYMNTTFHFDCWGHQGLKNIAHNGLIALCCNSGQVDGSYPLHCYN